MTADDEPRSPSPSTVESDSDENEFETSRRSRKCGFIACISLAAILTSLIRLIVIVEMRKSMRGSAVTMKHNQVDSYNPMKILYMITTSNEFQNGRRGTIKGQDRLMDIVMPVILESVESMLRSNYQVDVFLILGYTLNQTRQERVQSMLPEGVGLQVWNEATPYDYDNGKGDKISQITRALARQHRYVVRDKFEYYDLFCAFEDDMVIKADHIQNYLDMLQELQRLKSLAPEKLPDDAKGRFFGELPRYQLARMKPGFVRVEVILERHQKRQPTEVIDASLSVDFNFTAINGTAYHAEVDPSICCHVKHLLVPPSPAADELMVWESGVRSLGVREMPQPSSLGWITLLPGPLGPFAVSDYWVGSNGVLSVGRPGPLDPKHLAQSAGWMLTPREILELDEQFCTGGFLPPFETADSFPRDGLFENNVEFWSGGIQMWCKRCNIQRVISLDPNVFSKHLIYHSANNKQSLVNQARLSKINHVFGQLNSARKAAEKAKKNFNSTL